MTLTIAIIDYQMGNLRSVQKAFENSGHKAIVTSDLTVIKNADKIILPGVGGFPDAIRGLQVLRLDEPIVEAIQKGRHVLGICLGLQLLFDQGTEGGPHAGLGVLSGSVERFSGPSFESPDCLKVPHIGWNQVTQRTLGCPLFKGLSDREYFYFVHSYFVRPKDADCCWLEADYGGPFCAAIWKDNLFAVQFHPEKSQTAGLKLLKNFAEL